MNTTTSATGEEARVLCNLGRYHDTEEAVEEAYEEDHIIITRTEYAYLKECEKAVKRVRALLTFQRAGS